MTIPNAFLKLAVRNIAKYGDTDIFPFPIENYMFFDCEQLVIDALKNIDDNFDQYYDKCPILTVNSLSVVGYNGFRQATQIDPLWNAYFLALVITLGEEIENERIPISSDVVFSYRFKPDNDANAIFNKDIGWRAFQQASIERARNYAFVLSCDISDFYPRVYHHRLENALKRASRNTECIRRVKLILETIAGGVSYGLPVGGPAARLLSEVVLNTIDRLLVAHSITFCRFVDDFHIFAQSREDAYAYLVSLSQLLLENEGMALQKSKTRIVSKDEFLATSTFAEENQPETLQEQDVRRFIALRLRYDPYSPSAQENYELLKKELEEFDIVGMLAREIRKGRIEEPVTRQLIRAVKYLDPSVKFDAVRSLVESLHVLYPVFPAVMILIKSVLSDLDKETCSSVFTVIRTLIRQNSYVTRVPVNLAFALRVLAYDPSEETDMLLTSLYNQPWDMSIKRDIILIMAQRDAGYWISNCRLHYNSLSSWEKRAVLVASYVLEDEGAHWRRKISRDLLPMDQIAMKWAADKKNKNVWDLLL